MKLSTTIVVATLMGASLTATASADLLVSNLGNSTNFTASSTGAGVTNNVVYAAQFVTGASLTEVFGATARLQNIGANGFATYEGVIYANGAGSPGSVVATFDSMPSLAEGAGASNVSFVSTLGIVLDPNTVYWFGVRNTTGTYLGWHATRSDTETSLFGWTVDNDAVAISPDAGSHWSDYSGLYGGNVYKFAIEGNAVPAPGVFALLGAGGIIVARRRRG